MIQSFQRGVGERPEIEEGREGRGRGRGRGQGRGRGRGQGRLSRKEYNALEYHEEDLNIVIKEIDLAHLSALTTESYDGNFFHSEVTL